RKDPCLAAIIDESPKSDAGLVILRDVALGGDEARRGIGHWETIKWNSDGKPVRIDSRGEESDIKEFEVRQLSAMFDQKPAAMAFVYGNDRLVDYFDDKKLSDKSRRVANVLTTATGIPVDPFSLTDVVGKAAQAASSSTTSNGASLPLTSEIILNALK